MRSWTATFLKLIWGAYLVLTSIYCLLAFLPYTYFALIKSPAYAWMPWFAHHHRSFTGSTGRCVRGGSDRRNKRSALILFGVLALAGIGLVAWPFMPVLQNDWTAFLWSLIALLPLMMTAAWDLYQSWPAANEEHNCISLLEYSSGIMVAIAVAFLYMAAAAVHSHAEKLPLDFGLGKLEITAWSLLSHILVAIIVISILNLIRVVTGEPAAAPVCAWPSSEWLPRWSSQPYSIASSQAL